LTTKGAMIYKTQSVYVNHINKILCDQLEYQLVVGKKQAMMGKFVFQ
jgi:hypothetical protein